MSKDLNVSVGFGSRNAVDVSVVFGTPPTFPTLTPSQIFFSGQNSVTKIPHIELIDTSLITNMYSVFQNCSALQTLDVRGWDVSNVISMWNMFYGCNALQTLDVSGWNIGKVENTYGIFGDCHTLRTLIGDHTIEEVESGTITALKNAGKSTTNVQYGGMPRLRYSSLLALVNGIYDRAKVSTGILNLPAQAFNRCCNDDDTIPNATMIAERQAKIRSVCAAKGYNLILS